MSHNYNIVFLYNCIFHNCKFSKCDFISRNVSYSSQRHFGSQLWHGVLLCIYFAIATLSHNFTLYPMQPIPMQLFCNVTLYFAIAASLFLVIVISQRYFISYYYILSKKRKR